jgi:hypothetical protein
MADAPMDCQRFSVTSSVTALALRRHAGEFPLQQQGAAVVTDFMSMDEKQKLLFLFRILPKKHNVKVKGDSLSSEGERMGGRRPVGARRQLALPAFLSSLFVPSDIRSRGQQAAIG